MCQKRTSRLRFSALVFVFGALLAPFLIAKAAADHVVLKNGNRLDGVIRTESAQYIVIEGLGGTVTLDRKRIDYIEKRPTGENLMIAGTIALRKPDFLEAADLLKRSLRAGFDAALMRKTILEMSSYFLDRLAYLSKIERTEWLGLCDEITSRSAGDAEWIYLRGEMANAMGDSDAAIAFWRLLDAAYFSGHDRERERVIRWTLKRLSNLILDRRPEQSVGLLELMNVLDPERARLCRAALTMQKAAEARDRGNIAEACRIYADELMPLAPEISKVCLQTVIEPQCELLCSRGFYSEAAALVRQCAKPHLPELASRLLAKIYRDQISRSLANGQWETARGLLAEGSEFFDDAELERWKKECQYAEQRAHLAADDYAGHYKIGLELRERKMNGAAIEEFILASRSAELKEMARKQIALIHDGEALDLLEKINVSFAEKKYLEVLDVVDEFRRQFRGSDLSSKVDEIAKLAHQKVAKEIETAEALAMSRIEQARRLLYQGQADQAREMVDTVLKTHATTSSVALPARALKQEILRMKLAEGVAGGKSQAQKAVAATSETTSLAPRIDPALLDQLNQDAFKSELQEILKQLQL